MKLFTFISATVLAVLLQPATPWPHMAAVKDDLTKRLALSQGTSNGGNASPVLIGDLATVGATTTVGKSIRNILLRAESGQSSVSGYVAPGALGSKACKADTCCVWSYISAELTQAFKGPTGRCNKWARAAIRLGFHDAGAWSTAAPNVGGADGSIALSGTERYRTENNGLQDVVTKAIQLQAKYGVGMADLIQFAAVHGAVICPLGPRVRFFAGRKDSSAAPPTGLMPAVTDSADKIIALFQAKTIAPRDLVALVGAHSTAEQFFVNQSLAGAPQDSTPGVWDTVFYSQTTGKAPKGVFRFASDVLLSQDPRVSDKWARFATAAGQGHWNEDYAAAYTRLSLLGVNNINNLTECSKVLPPQTSTFSSNTPFLDQ